jgi:hypothetical protein
MRRFAATILTAGLSAPVFAQAPGGTLEQAKQIALVAAQKTEADIRAALSMAGRLNATDRPNAVAALKNAVAQLESDQTLSPARRSTLLRVVRDRLRVVELGPDSPEEVARVQKSEEEKRAADKELAAKAAADKAKIKEGLGKISQLRKDGKTVEAERVAADLARKFPDSTALQLLADNSSLAKGIADYEKTKKLNEVNTNAALLEVSKSGTPLVGDMTYPSDWKERTKGRSDLTAPTQEERALLKTLDTPVDATFKNSRFQDVMEYLSTAGNRTIVVDPAAAAEVNLNYDSPINMSARGQLALKTTLRQVLAPYNLTFVVRDGVIHVTTPQKARDLMTTKVYYLGDLIFGGLYGGAPNIGVAADQVQVVQNISALVEMITGAVDPLSWEKRGGQGHLGVNMPTLSLTVRQSQEVHVMLRSSLYGKK